MQLHLTFEDINCPKINPIQNIFLFEPFFSDGKLIKFINELKLLDNCNCFTIGWSVDLSLSLIPQLNNVNHEFIPGRSCHVLPLLVQTLYSVLYHKNNLLLNNKIFISPPIIENETIKNEIIETEATDLLLSLQSPKKPKKYTYSNCI